MSGSGSEFVSLVARPTPALILAPHPDDEVVGFAALIGRRRAAGGRVSVLFLSDGIPATRSLWAWDRAWRPARQAVRIAEARTVCAELGARIVGFQDRPSRTLKDDLAAALGGIRRALVADAGTELWVPTYEGGHQDHDTASFLGALLAREGHRVLEAALYSRADGRVRSQEFLVPPPPTLDGEIPAAPEILCLSEAERAHKRRLLSRYASERGNLAHITSHHEALRVQPRWDYSKPPHPGTVFHARFRWVPFDHPRVDRTDPARVREVLAAFEQNQPPG